MRKVLINEQIGARVGGQVVNMLQDAYGTTLITESVKDLKQLLAQVKLESGNHGLYLNLKKTKIMSNTDLDTFPLAGEYIEVVPLLHTR